MTIAKESKVKETLSAEKVTSGHWAMLGSISSICPLNCDFCFRKGSPKEFILDTRKIVKSVEEIESICKEIKNNGKVFDFTEDVGEFFYNKKIISIIKKFREYFPYELIDFTTSGISLVKEVVQQLSALAPIFLQVSLNSANPTIRKKVMKDPNPQIAIDGIKLLREFEIPFSATIVAWSTIPEQDILNTIRYLDEYDPIVIKINLPSYSRYFTGDVSFDTPTKWQSIVDLIENVRCKIKSAITWEPFLAIGDPLMPIVTGIVNNSPAQKSGVKTGDIIRKVDGNSILFREQARRLLIQRDENDRKRNITLERNNKVFEIELNDSGGESDNNYPHKPPFYPRRGKMFGLFIHQGLDVFGINRIAKIVNSAKSKSPLFASSQLLETTTKELIELLGQNLFHRGKVDVIGPTNNYLGGNIIIGDLLTVSDYVEGINEHIKNVRRPDLVIVPNSAFIKGLDIRGKHYSEISKETRIPVKLLDVERILV